MRAVVRSLVPWLHRLLPALLAGLVLGGSPACDDEGGVPSSSDASADSAADSDATTAPDRPGDLEAPDTPGGADAIDLAPDADQVAGVVLSGDSAGPPLSGARVTLLTHDLGFFREVRSDAGGGFAFDEVPTGTYRLGVAARDYEYVEVAVDKSDGRGEAVVLAVGPETHPGSWAVIGDTSEETFGGTNSGIVLPDGRVMFCHDTIDPIVFDPLTGAKEFPTQPEGIAGTHASEQGCHNLTHLLDGRVLYVGGGTLDDNGDFAVPGEVALDVVKAFNPVDMSWEVFPSLEEVRWYPGLSRLADGGLLAFGGGQQTVPMTEEALRTASSEVLSPYPEHASTDAFAWRPVGEMSERGGFGPAALLYTGEVFVSWYPPQLFDPRTGQWRNTANFLQPLRSTAGLGGSVPGVGDHPDHSIVVLPDGRVAAIGVFGNAMTEPGSMVEIYDPDSETWSLGASPEVVRAHVEVVPMPDGRIFVGAGMYQRGPEVEQNEEGFTRLVDLYDPARDAWRGVAPMSVPREYHAISLLLPDGRVLVAHGTWLAGRNPPQSANSDVEAYSPPYLFRGIRPRIDDLSTAEPRRGDRLTLTVSYGALTSVRLMGLSSVTHFLDAGIPRQLDLPVTQSGGTVTVDIPEDPVLVMAGYYILFAMVDDIPSEGRILRVLPAEVQ